MTTSISADARADDWGTVREHLAQIPAMRELLELALQPATSETTAATPRPRGCGRSRRFNRGFWGLLSDESISEVVSTLQQLYYDGETGSVFRMTPHAQVRVLSDILLPRASQMGAEVVELLLSSSTFRDFMTPTEQTYALNNALGHSVRPDVTHVLLAHGADPQVLVRHAAEARMHRTHFESSQTVEILVNHGAFVAGDPYLVRHQVLTLGTCSLVEKLVTWGADPTVTALLDAARFGRLSMMDSLVTNCHVDVDGFTYARGPALIEAIKTVGTRRQRMVYNTSTGAEEVVGKILSLGANPNVTDTDDHTAVCVALQSGKKAVVAQLLQHGADPNRVCCGHAPLHSVCQGASSPADVQCIEVLIQCGADVNARAMGDRTPLHMLVEALSPEPEKFIEAARMLLKAGADLTLKDSNGHTPVDLLRQRNSDEELVSVLLKSHHL